jgi:hypothetical protein
MQRGEAPNLIALQVPQCFSFASGQRPTCPVCLRRRELWNDEIGAVALAGFAAMLTMK